MNKQQANQKINGLYKRYQKLRQVSDATKYDWKGEEKLKADLQQITEVVGIGEYLSRASIIKLIRMQGSLRVLAHHRFYMIFSEAN